MHRPSAPGRLADQPVRAREERHEDQGANQDRHDVDRNLRVADAPHVHEAVGVLVREGASHERVRHPRDQPQLGQAGLGEDGTAHRDDQVRGQGRPDVGQDVAGEDPPRGHAAGARGQHVLLGQDAVLERYWAEHEWIGIDQHAHALSLCSLNEAPTREDVLELAPAAISSDFERAQVARIEAIADAIDQAAAGAFWLATQTLFDPEEDMDWRIVALVDMPASDEANRACLARSPSARGRSLLTASADRALFQHL